MAWNAALASQYGYGRVFREYPQEVLEQQPTRYQLPVFQPPPVGYPKLGQYWPHIMDAPEELAVLMQQPPRRLLAIFQPPPALVDYLIRLQQKWWPHAMDEPRSFEVLRQQPPRRLLPIFQPPPVNYPTRWRTYLDNWAAVGRLDDVLYIARNSLIPEPPVGPSSSWGWQLRNLAAVNRLDQIIYLTQTAILVTATVSGPTAKTIHPWVAEVTNWAAIINRVVPSVYQALNYLPPLIPAGGITPWSIESANWASIGRKNQITYLIQQGAGRVQNSLPPLHPWVTEHRNFASIGRMDNVVYWARNKYLPIGGYEFLSPPWRGEVSNWASLIGGAPIAIQLVRPIGPLIDAVPFIPAWQFEKNNWASIQYKQPIIFLIRTGLVVLSPFVFPPPPAIISASFWPWKQYYLEWPQVALGYRLPAYVTLPGPPQPPPPGTVPVSCFTIELPPTSTLFALGDTLQASMFLTESGLLVIYTGESPHICFN